MPDIKQIITQQILMPATALKDKYTNQKSASAAWVCIFSQSEQEYQELLEQANKLGDPFEETATGPKFLLDKPTVGGVRILKIRKPDPTKTERGDADFSVDDYQSFKEKYLGQENFKLIERENFEMIELMEDGASVRAYFSNPPIEEQYKDYL